MRLEAVPYTFEEVTVIVPHSKTALSYIESRSISLCWACTRRCLQRRCGCKAVLVFQWLEDILGKIRDICALYTR